MKSPCQEICKLHPDMNVCLGCYRTLDEIAAWSTMTEQQQIETLKRCQQRAMQRQAFEHILQLT